MIRVMQDGGFYTKNLGPMNRRYGALIGSLKMAARFFGGVNGVCSFWGWINLDTQVLV
jgi:hypothetical protein